MFLIDLLVTLVGLFVMCAFLAFIGIALILAFGSFLDGLQQPFRRLRNAIAVDSPFTPHSRIILAMLISKVCAAAAFGGVAYGLGATSGLAATIGTFAFFFIG